jgi:hypothetical protein
LLRIFFELEFRQSRISDLFGFFGHWIGPDPFKVVPPARTINYEAAMAQEIATENRVPWLTNTAKIQNRKSSFINLQGRRQQNLYGRAAEALGRAAEHIHVSVFLHIRTDLAGD